MSVICRILTISGVMLFTQNCNAVIPISDTTMNITKDGQLLHLKSGFLFPIQIGDFKREKPIQYDAEGYDISVGYNDYAHNIIATVYVYPAYGSLENEFNSVKTEILHRHQEIQQLSSSIAEITPNHISALYASFIFTDLFAGKIQKVKSELLISKFGNQFVEYRFSYPAEIQLEALPEVINFESVFVWPKSLDNNYTK